jgi:lysylphosphatidylglycerol synthetase-like protein (DUF2156 family)
VIQPRSLQLARVLIYFNAVLWLGFALIIAVGRHPSYPRDNVYFLPMLLGSSIGAIALALVAWRLRGPGLPAYWAALGILSVLLLAGLFDEVGYADLAFLIITAVPLALLVRNRGWYAQPAAPKQEPKRAA